MKSDRLSLPAILALLLFLAGLTSPALAELRAGAARVEITPRAGVPLGGYGARKGRPSSGVHDPLFAKALVLDDGGGPVALVTTDLIGISPELKRRAAEKAGIPAGRFLLCASHTHSGPGAFSPALFAAVVLGPYDATVLDSLVDGVASAVKQARERLQPATVGVGRRALDRYMRNRRSGSTLVDPDLTVLVARDRRRQPLAIVVNYTAHGTVLGAENMEFSADWMGPLQAELEREHPGAVALYTNGAVGDQSPNPPEGSSGFARAEAMGRAVADAVRELIPSIQPMAEPALRTVTREVTLPATPGAALLGAGPETVVQAVAIGEALLVALPGEPIVELGLRLKRHARSRGWQHPVIVGLANDHLGYFLTEAEFRKGGYEASVSFFGPTFGDELTAEAERLIDSVRPGEGSKFQVQSSRLPGEALPERAPERRRSSERSGLEGELRGLVDRLARAAGSLVSLEDLLSAMRLFESLGLGGRSGERAAEPEKEEARGLFDRLSMDRLARIRGDVERLRATRVSAQAAAPRRRYHDYRAILHAHSYLSHDSRGTVEEILAGAKAAGVDAIFMTDHYTDDRRFLKEALRGMRDGVLFIPGTELSSGLLAFRIDDVEWPANASETEILERLNAKKGLAFIAHPENRTEWKLPPFAGMEIYNTHADAEDTGSPALPSLRGSEALPAWMGLISAFRQYPQEAFAAIFDVPAATLATWDRLNETRKVVGIAGNDSHNNVGFAAKVAEGGMLEVWDVLGKKVAEVPVSALPPFLFGGLRPTPGQTLLELRLDPYPISFGYVSTHILTEADPGAAGGPKPAPTERALFRALEHGRAYVAFDWIAGPTGFAFEGTSGRRTVTMGDTLKRSADSRLVVTSPLPASLRLLRNGREVARGTGTRLEHTPTEPGAYRAEVWVTLAGEERPWIYSNPIRVE